MYQRDFLRRLPDHGEVRQQRSLSQMLHLDIPLLFLLLILSSIGLVVLYSASGQSFDTIIRQSTFFLLAYAAMFITAQVTPGSLRRWSPWLFVLGVVLLVLVFFIGVGSKGAQRWLDLPGLPRFQPSEIIKLFLPMTLAAYLSKRHLPPSLSVVAISLLIIAIPAGLIFKQPDLGTSILIFASGFFVLFLAGLSWRYLFWAGVTLLGSIYPVWHFALKPYQRQRVLTLLDPESDKLGAGWNIIQSKTAIGSGGWSGKGWLQGTQSQLDFLPESHTDFIIAVLAEEFGLMGVLLLFSVYFCIILRGGMIAYMAQSNFSRMLAASITLTFFVYIFVNMGMVSGLLPVVGVPLPLVSQGGTSIVSLMTAFGVLMAISTDQKKYRS